MSSTTKTNEEIINYWTPIIINTLRDRMDNIIYLRKQGDKDLRNYAAELQQIAGPVNRALKEIMQDREKGN